ncbi:MAG: cation:proton antiporter [Pseudomonadota bacterium]
MDNHLDDLTAIALVFGVAVLCGLLLTRLRQPAIVGYILAGVVLGPTGLAIVRNSDNVQILAELGVLLLLFLIGMELSLRALSAVLLTAVSAMALQLLIALGIGFGMGEVFGWSVGQSVLIGFVVALSSTAVAIKILEDIDELRSPTGRVTVAVLLAQDLAFVPMILIVESFRPGAGFGYEVIIRIVVAVAVLGLLIWLLGKRGKITLPIRNWVRRQVDLVPLAALAICMAAATLAGLAGLTPAYGAFVAGLVIANSTDRKPMIRATQPIQSVLLVVFFLSIGLLLDLNYIWTHLWTVLILLVLVVVTKTVLNVAILRLLREPWERAFPAGVAMGQLGEFSFVLLGVGLSVSVLDRDGYRLAIAVIALSLLISPIWTVSARRFHTIAAKGVSNIRKTLGEVYSDEIQAVQTTGRAVRVAGEKTVQAVTGLYYLARVRKPPQAIPPPPKQLPPPDPSRAAETVEEADAEVALEGEEDRPKDGHSSGQ